MTAIDAVLQQIFIAPNWPLVAVGITFLLVLHFASRHLRNKGSVDGVIEEHAWKWVTSFVLIIAAFLMGILRNPILIFKVLGISTLFELSPAGMSLMMFASKASLYLVLVFLATAWILCFHVLGVLKWPKDTPRDDGETIKESGVHAV